MATCGLLVLPIREWRSHDEDYIKFVPVGWFDDTAPAAR
jgi:hypothetical protein